MPRKPAPVAGLRVSKDTKGGGVSRRSVVVKLVICLKFFRERLASSREWRYLTPRFARVVSSVVEQLAFNQLVEGSNPSRPTIF